MVTTDRQAPAVRGRAALRFAALAAGAALLAWHLGVDALWAVVVLFACLGVTVGLSISAAERAMRVFSALEGALLQAVTWGLLGLVFVVIFVPGRLLIRLRPDRRRESPEGSYWHPVRGGESGAPRFDRQF